MDRRPAVRTVADERGNAGAAGKVYQHCDEAAALAAELQASSADFRRLWAENDVCSYRAGRKRLQRPPIGPIMLEYSAFAVDGANGLSMVVYTPLSPANAQAIDALLSRRDRAA